MRTRIGSTAEQCAPPALTPMGFNDLFCLSRPEVHTLSAGVVRPSDFDALLDVLPMLEDAAERVAPAWERIEAAATRNA